MGTGQPRTGSGNSSGKEVTLAKKPSHAGAGFESQSTANSQGAASSGNWTTTDKSQTSNAETLPADPSPSGVEVTMDTSPAGASSKQNWCATAPPDGLSGKRTRNRTTTDKSRTSSAETELRSPRTPAQLEPVQCRTGVPWPDLTASRGG